VSPARIEVVMEGRGSRLAARFRKAVEDRDAARRQGEEAARAAGEDARGARTRVLADLEAIARDIGSIEVTRVASAGKPPRDAPPAALQLRLQGRTMTFAPQGDADRVDITLEEAAAEEHWLYRQAELDQRWVYARKRRGREDRVPLFDLGLEELLIRGLGLPRPPES
jgi:hypothetical protein